MTIYLVRAYEGIKVILTFFALFTAGPEAIFYLLFVLLWLLYFFKSPRVKAIYFSEQNVMHVTT